MFNEPKRLLVAGQSGALLRCICLGVYLCCPFTCTLQSCKQATAHTEAEMQVSKQKHEKLLSDLRRDVTDSRAKNDALSEKLVCQFCLLMYQCFLVVSLES